MSMAIFRTMKMHLPVQICATKFEEGGIMDRVAIEGKGPGLDEGLKKSNHEFEEAVMLLSKILQV